MAEKPIFDKNNVLVTGGAGFIGSFLCERLLREGNRVICVDNFVTSQVENIKHLLKDDDFEFLRHDINIGMDLESFTELERFKIKFQGIQEIYHLACPTSVKNFQQHRQATVLANSVGMRNILDLAVKYEAKFFQASTSVVYGTREAAGDQAIKENYHGCPAQLEPRSCYDVGKYWAETMAYTYGQVHNLDVRIGRIFRTYGPRMPIFDGQMIPDFILNALDGKDLVIHGKADFRSSLIYVTDVVDGIARMMQHPKNPGPLNIGSDQDLRLSDVAHKIIELTGSSSQVVLGEELEFMRELCLPDLSQAKGLLGWIPLVTLEHGLKKSIEYTVASKGLLRPNMS